MEKNKKKPEPKLIESIKSNPRIDEIVADYPESLMAYPRASFEDQLKKHLLKHGVR